MKSKIIFFCLRWRDGLSARENPFSAENNVTGISWVQRKRSLPLGNGDVG